jgi:hypothetical protein
MICVPAAGRPAFRVGAWDRNGREHREDGADDHLLQTGSKLASLWGDRAGTVSPRRSRHQSRSETQNQVGFLCGTVLTA